jgi:N-formylglutamate deformylase
MPHVGTRLPTETARRVPDTDWHVDRLYDFVGDLGASTLHPVHSRYVVDLNRPPDGANLYPGQDTTGLCPDETFDGETLYLDGAAPTDDEVAQRVKFYWRPYHEKIATELARLKEQYGVALLWEAHSIRSHVPRLFEGRLPDLNLGTAGGSSCAPDLAERLAAIANDAAGYTAILNGRFTGGYITRHFGNPDAGVHAVQLELTQSSYMEESYPFAFDEGLAQKLRPTLRKLIEAMLEWAEP